jgi:hypothetical protein
LFSQVRDVRLPRASNVKVWLETVLLAPARIDCTNPVLGLNAWVVVIPLPCNWVSR